MKELLRAIAAAALSAAVLPGCGSLIVTQKSVDTLAGRHGFDWQTHEADGFDVYAEPGLAAAEDPEAYAVDAAAAKERVLAHLDLTAYEPTISIFVVSSRGRMKDLIGRPTQAMGYYSSNAVCLVGPHSGRGTLAHEMLHVVAMNAWGLPERWINEGLAVDAPGLWRGNDPHAVCKHLRARGELPSLQDLTRRFDRLPALASYPAAGSFVRYLRETYGLETVRVVWEGGRRALPEATGLDPAGLEQAWLAVVEASDAEGLAYPAITSR